MKCKTFAEVKAEVQRARGRGIRNALYFLARRTKETLNVQAPTTGRGKHRIATTPATADAPPRRVAGKLQRSVKARLYTHNNEGGGCIEAHAASPSGFRYGVYHEDHDHKFMLPTFEQYRAAIADIMDRSLRGQCG